MVHHLTATARHLPYGITQCYLPPDTSERAPPNVLTPVMKAGTRFSSPGGMEGWVDLVYLIAPRPGVELWTSDLSITSPTRNRCTTKTSIGAGQSEEAPSRDGEWGGWCGGRCPLPSRLRGLAPPAGSTVSVYESRDEIVGNTLQESFVRFSTYRVIQKTGFNFAITSVNVR